MADAGGVRRAELAVGAFGATALLLSLVFVLDAVRFHHDILLDALRLRSDLRGYLLLALAAFDLAAMVRAARALARGLVAHRRVARLPLRDTRVLAGRRVAVVRGVRPVAFCSGLLRPRIVISEGVLGLGAGAVSAIVEHEAAHAARRDPLRILVARAVGEAFSPAPSFRALSRREQALTDLAADAGAVRALGEARPLAAALLAFGDGAGIAPERVDRLAGERPAHEVPRALLVGAGVVVGTLVAMLALALALPGQPSVCLPLATAPAWTLAAIGARLAAMWPAWLSARRAAAFLG